MLARAGLGCLGWCMRSVQLHLASRQAEDGARGQELGPASPHRTPTLMAPAPGMFSAFTIKVESFSHDCQAVGLAWFVTAGRKLVTVYA